MSRAHHLHKADLTLDFSAPKLFYSSHQAIDELGIRKVKDPRSALHKRRVGEEWR